MAKGDPSQVLLGPHEAPRWLRGCDYSIHSHRGLSSAHLYASEVTQGTTGSPTVWGSQIPQEEAWEGTPPQPPPSAS